MMNSYADRARAQEDEMDHERYPNPPEWDDREEFEQEHGSTQDQEKHGMDAPEALAARVLDLMAALREALRGDRGRRNALCTCGGRSDDWENHAVECVWRQQNATLLNRPYATQARLDAEVAAHESGWTGADSLEEVDLTPRTIEIANLTDEPVEYRVIVRGERPEPEARFGDRLRRWLGIYQTSWSHLRPMLEEVADAIDRDRDELRNWVKDEAVRRVEEVEGERRAVILAELGETVRRDLRRRIEEAVERLSYETYGQPPGYEEPGDLTIVPAEDLLVALGAIFGERPASSTPDFQVNLLGTADGMAWAQEFVRLFGDRREEIDEGLMLAWFANAIMVGWDHGRARLLEEQDRERSDHAEHEPAHDRRERDSSRHEDRDGRVEGVDR